LTETRGNVDVTGDPIYRHCRIVAVGIASGERIEEKLVAETLSARFIEALSTKLIGDKAYDSVPLDAQRAERSREAKPRASRTFRDPVATQASAASAPAAAPMAARWIGETVLLVPLGRWVDLNRAQRSASRTSC
jgi:hypothetical protein